MKKKNIVTLVSVAAILMIVVTVWLTIFKPYAVEGGVFDDEGNQISGDIQSAVGVGRPYVQITLKDLSDEEDVVYSSGE